jgi:N-acylneuraminate cytidylyltransferase
MNIVVIPARGGTKGIHRKNLAKVHGVSLIERAIISVKKSDANLGILSTDDHEIAEIGRKYDLVIHRRGRENSSDFATTESVLEEVVAEFSSEWPINSTLAFIQATSPFLTPFAINKCLELAAEGNSSFTATETHSFKWKQKRDVPYEVR